MITPKTTSKFRTLPVNVELTNTTNNAFKFIGNQGEYPKKKLTHKVSINKDETSGDVVTKTSVIDRTYTAVKALHFNFCNLCNVSNRRIEVLGGSSKTLSTPLDQLPFTFELNSKQYGLLKRFNKRGAAFLGAFSLNLLNYTKDQNNYEYKEQVIILSHLITIIRDVHLQSKNSSISLTNPHVLIVLELLHNTVYYLRLKMALTDKIGISINTNLLYKLFIEPEKQRSGFLSFENEPGYILRTQAAFVAALNIIFEKGRLDYADLIIINAIAGGFVSKVDMHYPFNIKHNDLNSLKASTQGNNLFELQALMNRSQCLGEKRIIRKVNTIIERDSNFINDCKIDTENTKNYYKGTDLHLSCDLRVRFKAPKNPHDMISGHISYQGKTSKPQRVQDLLDAYFKSCVIIRTRNLDTQQKMSQFVTLAVKLSRELIRVHPFFDANGRALYFILVPILLLHEGYWVNGMPTNPWAIDWCSLDVQVAKIIPYCKPISFSKLKSKVDLKANLPIKEQMRIACVLGDINTFKQLADNNSSLLNTIIRPTNLNFLQLAIASDQVEIVKYLIVTPSFSNYNPGSTDIIGCCERRLVNVLGFLFDHYDYENLDYNTLLGIAVREQSTEILSLVLQQALKQQSKIPLETFGIALSTIMEDRRSDMLAEFLKFPIPNCIFSSYLKFHNIYDCDTYAYGLRLIIEKLKSATDSNKKLNTF